jgi:acyl carrier protein
MTRDEIRTTVLDALSEIAPEIDLTAIDVDAPLRDQVDLDSMDLLNFLISVDEKLGVDIPESDYGKITTVNGLVQYVDQQLRAAPERP